MAAERQEEQRQREQRARDAGEGEYELVLPVTFPEGLMDLEGKGVFAGCSTVHATYE